MYQNPLQHFLIEASKFAINEHYGRKVTIEVTDTLTGDGKILNATVKSHSGDFHVEIDITVLNNVEVVEQKPDKDVPMPFSVRGYTAHVRQWTENGRHNGSEATFDDPGRLHLRKLPFIQSPLAATRQS